FSSVKSDGAGLESYSQSATTARSEGNRAIIRLRVAAAHQDLADEGYRLWVRQVRVVEKRNRQRGARVAHRLTPKIQTRARQHPQWAWGTRFQLHRKTSAIDFARVALRRQRTSRPTLQRVQFQKIIQTAIYEGVRLRRIHHL